MLLALTTALTGFQVKVTLPLTASQPGYLSEKHPTGAQDQIFVAVKELWVC